ncbi:MAG TPA: efflux RND transporter periplasmic adaptor subunit [Stellaceae bacterium]|nr:efflux RND transporter periplasmic adaptor subunit [Stellaceae bacterium]
MSDAPVRTPKRRSLVLFGTTALVVAGVVAVSGIIGRAHSEQELTKWTQEQAIPTVTLAEHLKGGASEVITLPGTIQPYYKASIFSRVPGYLKSWNVDIGAHVKTGQVLAIIDTPDLDQQLDQAKANLASAEANAKLAQLTAHRWAALVSSQSVSQQDADQRTGDAAVKQAQVLAAQAAVHRIQVLEGFKTITAPFDGVVTSRDTDIGALINAGGNGRELFTVSDMHRMRIYVSVPQAFVSRLKPGEQATFDMPQFPGRTFHATLVTTANAVSDATRSMLFELQTDNPDGLLPAGVYCEVHFTVPTSPDVVRLPATALIVTNHATEVAVLGPNNTVHLQPIQIGRDEGDSVEIASGLAPEDKVIDNPPETIESGMTVRLATTPSQVAAGGKAD